MCPMFWGELLSMIRSVFQVFSACMHKSCFLFNAVSVLHHLNPRDQKRRLHELLRKIPRMEKTETEQHLLRSDFLESLAVWLTVVLEPAVSPPCKTAASACIFTQAPVHLNQHDVLRTQPPQVGLSTGGQELFFPRSLIPLNVWLLFCWKCQV